MKFDTNGNIKLSKIFTDPSQITLRLSYLQIVSIVLIEDNDVVINGRVSSLSSSISYSNDSSIDQVVFRVNQNGESIWTTVFDYQLGYDIANKMTSFGSKIYTGMFSNLNYPWFISINGTDGRNLQSKWYSFFVNKSNDFMGK